jgi:hypothetical protein
MVQPVQPLITEATNVILQCDLQLKFSRETSRAISDLSYMSCENVREYQHIKG